MTALLAARFSFYVDRARPEQLDPKEIDCAARAAVRLRLELYTGNPRTARMDYYLANPPYPIDFPADVIQLSLGYILFTFCGVTISCLVRTAGGTVLLFRMSDANCIRPFPYLSG